jgi:hypothetical protein
VGEREEVGRAGLGDRRNRSEPVGLNRGERAADVQGCNHGGGQIGAAEVDRAMSYARAPSMGMTVGDGVPVSRGVVRRG